MMSCFLTTSARAEEKPGLADYYRGAEFFSRGNYADASLSLEVALRADPSQPAFLFSLAQSRRKQAEEKGIPAAVTKLRIEEALLHFRRYVELGTGTRLGEAELAARDLSAQLKALAEERAESPDALVLFTSEPRDVLVSVDDIPREPGTRSLRLAPGKHVVRAVAVEKGYHPIVKTIDVRPRESVSLAFKFDPIPGRLAIVGTPGAEVWVDQQRWSGVVPLVLELAPGIHTVSVRKRGYQLVEYPRVDVERGGSRELKSPELRADLRVSASRITSYVSFGLAGAAAAVAIGTTVAALRSEDDAGVFETKRDTMGLRDPDKGPRNEAIRGRDDLRTASIVGFSAAVGFTSLGLALFFFDTPLIPPAAFRERTFGSSRGARGLRCAPQPAFGGSGFAGGFVGCSF